MSAPGFPPPLHSPTLQPPVLNFIPSRIPNPIPSPKLTNGGGESTGSRLQKCMFVFIFAPALALTPWSDSSLSVDSTPLHFSFELLASLPAYDSFLASFLPSFRASFLPFFPPCPLPPLLDYPETFHLIQFIRGFRGLFRGFRQWHSSKQNKHSSYSLFTSPYPYPYPTYNFHQSQSNNPPTYCTKQRKQFSLPANQTK